MNTRWLKNAYFAAIYSILVTAINVTAVPSAQAEALFLFRSPEYSSSTPELPSRSPGQKMLLRLDEKGDLQIQCGSARFSVAYNAPADQLKPSEQQYVPRRDYITNINGISLTATLSF